MMGKKVMSLFCWCRACVLHEMMIKMADKLLPGFLLMKNHATLESEDFFKSFIATMLLNSSSKGLWETSIQFIKQLFVLNTTIEPGVAYIE